jgi:CRISPR-associated protein Cmr4
VEIDELLQDAIFGEQESIRPLNLGWLLLPVKKLWRWEALQGALKGLGVPDGILRSLGVLPDKLFGHVVNSNLEVRTSVAIDPATGAAEEGKLFTYEALPRATVLIWEVTCKHPGHFTIGSSPVAFSDGRAATIEDVHKVVVQAHAYLEHLGIGGMGTRGMGRLQVLPKPNPIHAASEPASRPAAPKVS